MTINIGGIDVNYEIYGDHDRADRTFAVILEGWNTSVPVYRFPASLLAGYYPTVVLDLPGFGLTPEPPEAWSTDLYADFVSDFLTALGIRKVILWGHSFGGKLAVILASRQNTDFEIDSLILNDSSGLVAKKSFVKRYRQRRYKFLRKLYSTKFFKCFYPDALPELRARNGSADYNSATPLMRAVLVRHVNEDVRDRLTDIRVKTLLIWGEDDTATPIEQGKLMEQSIPDAGLVSIKGAGHYPFLDQPAIYASVISSFLDA